MGKTLDSFINVLPRLQARNIEKELQKPSERVKYRTAQEFKEALQQKLRELLERETEIRLDLKPLITDRYRESEIINYMIEMTSNDLSALFFSADLMLQAEDLMIDIFKNEVIDKLRAAALEAESEIERLELLKGNVSGLKEAIVEKFVSGASRLSRNDIYAATAYVDPKENIRIIPELDMPVGLNVGGLVLPTNTQNTIRPSLIKDVNTSDSRDDLSDRFGLPRAVSPSTTGIVREVGSIEKVIDRTAQTFWIKSVDVPGEILGGAKLNLSIDLGPSSSEANFIEIHPVGRFEQELIELFYVDDTAQAFRIDLQTTPVKLTEPVRIYFKKINARKLIAIFNQPNSIVVRNIDGQTSNNRYTFGLDNILIGKVKYKNNGYFVSRTLSLPQISKLHLVSKENGFIGVSSEEELNPSNNPLPTIEYWTVIREIDSSDNILETYYLPILPIGKTIVKEKLEIRQNHLGKLSFMLDTNLADDSEELKLRRDGNLITRPLDYTFTPPDSPIAEQAILSIPEGFNQSYEYIAEYTPLHTKEGTAPIPFEDRTGQVRYNSDNTISINRPESSKATRSEANLIIIMRGVGNGTNTSVVDEVVFAVG